MTISATLAAVAPTQPTSLQVWLPAALSAVATIAVGWLVYRSSRKANATTERMSLSQSQLAWTQQAMTEATEAKHEAREATTAARAATTAAESAARRADAAEDRLREVTNLTGSLLEWISRVVRKAHTPGIEAGASEPVAELLRVINGGPPEITSERLKRIQDEGGQ